MVQVSPSCVWMRGDVLQWSLQIILIAALLVSPVFPVNRFQFYGEAPPVHKDIFNTTSLSFFVSTLLVVHSFKFCDYGGIRSSRMTHYSSASLQFHSVHGGLSTSWATCCCPLPLCHSAQASMTASSKQRPWRTFGETWVTDWLQVRKAGGMTSLRLGVWRARTLHICICTNTNMASKSFKCAIHFAQMVDKY